MFLDPLLPMETPSPTSASAASGPMQNTKKMDRAPATIGHRDDIDITVNTVAPMHSCSHGADQLQEKEKHISAGNSNNTKHVSFTGPLPTVAFPEVDEVLMVRVKLVTEAGLLVRILEFNADGFVPAEEVSARRKKNFSPAATFKVGKELPAKVTFVDPKSNFIDLSLKAVNAVEARECARARAKKDATASTSTSASFAATKKKASRCKEPAVNSSPPAACTEEESDDEIREVDTVLTDEFLQGEIAALLHQARASTLDSKCVQDSVRLEILSLKNELNVPVADCAIALLKAVLAQAVSDLRAHTASPPKSSSKSKKAPTLSTFLARGIAEWADVLSKLCATPDAALELLLWAAEFFHTQQQHELPPALFAVLLFQLYDKDVIADELVFRRWREWCVHENLFPALLGECDPFFRWLDTADEE